MGDGTGGARGEGGGGGEVGHMGGCWWGGGDVGRDEEGLGEKGD